jgi:serine/threonine protein kinase
MYAIKSIRKDMLIESHQIEGAKLEKSIMLTINHPFLAGMEYVFQNELRIYFVMDFIK